MEKMHVIGRTDLGIGLFTAQVVHAARQLQHEHPEVEAAWFQDSNNVAVLGVPDEVALQLLYDRARALGIPCAAFHEEDLGGSLTAIAMLGGKRVTSGIPTAKEELFGQAA